MLEIIKKKLFQKKKNDIGTISPQIGIHLPSSQRNNDNATSSNKLAPESLSTSQIF